MGAGLTADLFLCQFVVSGVDKIIFRNGENLFFSIGFVIDLDDSGFASSVSINSSGTRFMVGSVLYANKVTKLVNMLFTKIITVIGHKSAMLLFKKYRLLILKQMRSKDFPCLFHPKGTTSHRALHYICIGFSLLSVAFVFIKSPPKL